MTTQNTTPTGPVGFKNFQPRGGPIALPNFDGTHQYTVPPVDYETGLELKMYQELAAENSRVNTENLEALQTVQRENRAAAEEAAKAKKKLPEPQPLPDPKPLPHEFSEDEGPTPERMLGPVLDQMRANNEPQQMIEQATVAAWMDFLHGREVAEEYWNSGGDLKAVYDLLVSRGQMSPWISTSTGEANTTKKPGSTSGTKSRPKPNTKSTNTTKTTKPSSTTPRSATKK